ncbi:MAG: hypothetical protein HY904_08345 [Deltaproteobacteria bacterium]|nr:hypothetical protein [Deltaproteobacteria bacterium]
MCAALAVTACPSRPVPGKHGCVRQVDCQGRERCDTATGRCVLDDGSLDAGPCAATLAGCTDDALANRAPECATPVPTGGDLYADLLMCPTTRDHFLLEMVAGDKVEVLAWPSTPVDLALSLTDQGSSTPRVSETNPSTALTYLAADALPSGSYVLGITAQSNATYTLMVRVGGPCVDDGDCATGRCEPMAPDLYATGTVPSGELTRGGICVDNAASPCGDSGTEPNRRADATTVSTAGTTTLWGTCTADVDWVRFSVPGDSADVTVRINCSSSSNGFRPHLLLLDGSGALEWAELLYDYSIGGEATRTIPRLRGTNAGTDPGTHYLRLAQLAGPLGGSCSLKVNATAAICSNDGDCQGETEAARFGRTRCVTSACVR